MSGVWRLGARVLSTGGFFMVNVLLIKSVLTLLWEFSFNPNSFNVSFVLFFIEDQDLFCFSFAGSCREEVDIYFVYTFSPV